MLWSWSWPWLAMRRRKKNEDTEWVSTNTRNLVGGFCSSLLPERFCVVTFTFEEWFRWNEKLKKQTPIASVEEWTDGWLVARVLFSVFWEKGFYSFLFLFSSNRQCRALSLLRAFLFHSALCHFVDKEERIQRWHIREQWVRFCVFCVCMSERTGGWIIAFR